MKRLNKQLTSESGRSMVEMLGVLAIVGVLSIGGVAGYQYAMNKHRANTILYEVSEMAVTGSGQLLAGNELTLNEFGTHIDGIYEFGFEGDYSGTQSDFSIIVYDIPQAVCQHIQNAEFIMPYLRLMNDSDSGVCEEGLNTAEFVFKDNLGGLCRSDADCSYCQHCENKRCVADEECSNGCSGDTPLQKSDGSCAACPLASSDWTRTFNANNQAECDICGNKFGLKYTYDPSTQNCVIQEEDCVPGKGWARSDEPGVCLPCDGGWSIHSRPYSLLQECIEACPNRIIGDDGWGDACMLPDDKCDFRDGWGSCRICGEFTQFWDPYMYGDEECATPCNDGITFSPFNYWDECTINCGAKGFGTNVSRCCTDDEVYTHIGESDYGHPYGACCPKSRPNWNGSKCTN